MSLCHSCHSIQLDSHVSRSAQNTEMEDAGGSVMGRRAMGWYVPVLVLVFSGSLQFSGSFWSSICRFLEEEEEGFQVSFGTAEVGHGGNCRGKGAFELPEQSIDFSREAGTARQAFKLFVRTVGTRLPF